jgi:hypothetical protein
MTTTTLATVTAPSTETLKLALANFLVKAQEIVDRDRNAKFPTLARQVLQVAGEGRRYMHIAITSEDGSRSSFCWIDLTNGDVLKSESWKKPAKHARGNIFAENPVSGITAYGAAYMR